MHFFTTRHGHGRSARPIYASNVEQIVEARYLYCHPGPEEKLIQAKCFGNVRDDVAVSDCRVSQLKVKAGDSAPTESVSQIDVSNSGPKVSR